MFGEHDRDIPNSELDHFMPTREPYDAEHDEAEHEDARYAGTEHHRLVRESSASLAEVASSDGASHITLADPSNDRPEGMTALSQEQHDDETHVTESLSTSAARRGHRRLFSAWWLEIAACITILAGILALFATLYAYMDRPSPNWPKWISLNTIVSIYVTLVKTGIALILSEGIGQLKWSWFTGQSRPLHDIKTWDDATRGPVGAAVLLGNLRGRDLLASLGALLVVLVLAVDPFAQQLIHYYNCDIAVSGLASIPRIRHFSQPGSDFTGARESIVPGVINALNAGVFSPTPNPPFECSTGNCTWTSNHSTLAWCSTCEDVSHELQIVNNTFLDTTCGDYCSVIGYDWNYTTSIPNGISVNKSRSGMFWDYAAMGPSPLPARYANTCYGCSAGIDFLFGATPGGALNPSTHAPYPECTDATLNDTWPCQGFGASRCTFQPCIKTFNAAVRLGQLEETLVETTTDWGSNAWKAGGGGSMLDAKCLSLDELQSLRDVGYSFGDTQRWLPYNDTIYVDDTGGTFKNNVNVSLLTDSMESRGCFYSYDQTWQYSINEYLARFLTGVVVGYAPEPDFPPGNFMGPQSVQSIFNFGNVTFESIRDSFANISTGLTNYMRLHPDPNNTPPAIGISKETKICVGVRWPWIAYPATLVLLTLVFFFLLFVDNWTTRFRPKVWKSSPLALLYHGLRREVQPGFGEIEHHNMSEPGQMKAKAKSTYVTLEESGEGVAYFVEQQQKTD